MSLRILIYRTTFFHLLFLYLVAATPARAGGHFDLPPSDTLEAASGRAMDRRTPPVAGERDSAKIADTLALIESKVKFDAHYSNLYSVQLLKDELLNLFRTNNSGNVELVQWPPVTEVATNGRPDADYETFVHFTYVETASISGAAKRMLVPMRVLRIKYQLDSTLYARDVTVAPETTDVGFTDILRLAQFDTHGYFQQMTDFLSRLPSSRIRMLRTVPIVRQLPFIGTDPGNGDYRNYVSVHSAHRYIKAGVSNGRRERRDITDTSVELPLYVDISLFPLERIAFSHDLLSAPEGLGLLGFGFEAGFEDRVLGLLSYQTSYLRIGGRLLFTLSGRQDNIGDDYFLDLKILGRVPRSMRYTRSRLNLPTWILNYDDPKLNVTGGVIFDISLGRFDYRMPFINLYYAHGSSDYSRPLYTAADNTAFFSRTQWEASLAYYWNTDRERYNRFRLDLGAGAYNIYLVGPYDGRDVSVSPFLFHGLTSVQALISLDYTHASNNNQTMFGMKLRWFDNRITVAPWLKIFSIAPHEVRMEATIQTPPIARTAEPWEGLGALRLQVRYRLGF
jgi:hypothetical protein